MAGAACAVDVDLTPRNLVSRGNRQRPLVVLSRLTTQSHAKFPAAVVSVGQTPQDRSGCASQFAAGKMQLKPPQAGTELVALIVSPKQDRGDYFRPVAVEHEGGSLTVVCEHWTTRHVDPLLLEPVHAVYAVSLGMLPAGEYTLHYEVQERFMNFQKNDPNYRPSTLTFGKTPVRVATVAGQEPCPIIPLKALATKPVAEKARQRLLQLIFPTVVQTADPGAQGLPAALRVGRLDTGVWRPQREGPVPIPEMTPAEAGRLIYVSILGPPMRGTDTILLREIEWIDRRAILRVELWRKAGQSAELPTFRTVLVESISPVVKRTAMPAGNYTLEVQWSLMYAPSADGLYSRSTVAEIVADPGAHAIEREFVEFTRRAGSSLVFEVLEGK